MKPRFAIGDIVRTVRGSVIQGEGVIHEISAPSKELQMLWGTDELHYIFRDNESGEYISVIEGGIEKV